MLPLSSFRDVPIRAAALFAGALGVLALVGLVHPPALPAGLRIGSALGSLGLFATVAWFEHRHARRVRAALDGLATALEEVENGDGTCRILHREHTPVARVTRRINRILGKLESEAAHWSAVIETAVDAVIVIDAGGRIRSINPAGAAMFGWSVDELVGRPVTVLMPSPYAEEHDGHVAEHVRTGRRNVLDKAREVTAMRRDGTMFAAQIAVARMTIEGQVFFSGMLRDVSRARALEDELREHADALEAANRRAMEAVASKTAFLANMSHEIRTPMTAILGYVDLLGDPGTTESERTEFLDTVRRNGTHLLQLINDILDLSRVEADRVEIERTEVTLRDITRDVLSTLAPRADEKGLTLDIVPEGDLPRTIETDPMRLRQILMNLIGNALKFTEVGGIDVRVRTRTRAGHPLLQFAVHDTGIGMDADAIERIFHPFTQADASTTRRFGGSGLGLTISRRLAQLLGGDLTAQSTPGLGSVFTLTIDPGRVTGEDTIRAFDARDVRRTEESKEPAAGLEGRVLLAEDNEVNQKLVERLVGRMGLEVDIVPDGARAVHAVLDARDAGTPYDVILMDMLMPVMDGYDATRSLRAQGLRQPIVALTANAMSGDRERCLQAGCDEFVSKPIDRETLHRVLCAVLAGAPAA